MENDIDMSKLIEQLKNPPPTRGTEYSPMYTISYRTWEKQILATLRAEGWVKVDEVLARLPKKVTNLERIVVLEPWKNGYNAALSECIEAIKQLGGADEANHKG